MVSAFCSPTRRAGVLSADAVAGAGGDAAQKPLRGSGEAADNKTGYEFGVSHNPGKPKPYHVSGAGQAWWGKKVHLPSVEAPQLLPVRDRPLGSID